MTPRKILIVEDDAFLARDLRTRLETLGYSVLKTVTTGEAAVVEAATLLPDIVLVDRDLHGPLAGDRVARELRHIADIPVVHIISSADPQVVAISRAADPFDCVLKPFDDRELRLTLEMAVYRRHVDASLREIRAWHDTLIREMDMPFVLVQTEQGGGRLTVSRVNPAFERLTGIVRMDAVGRDLRDVLPGVNDRWVRLCSDVLDRGTTVREEVALPAFPTMIFKVTACRPARTQCAMTLFPVTVQSTVHEPDIPPPAPEELLPPPLPKVDLTAQAEEKYGAVFDHASMGMFETDPAGRATRVNAALVQMLGCTDAEELLGVLNLPVVGAGSDDGIGVEEPRVVLARGESGGTDKLMVRRDGSSLWVRETTWAVRDAGGEVIQYAGILEDITERRAMEERLRGTNDFLRNVLNSSSSISIIGTDLTGTVEFWNTGAENLFGYSAAEMVARMSISLLYPPDEPETATIVDEIQRIVIRGKRTISRELRELRKDGKKLWVRVTVSPRLNRDGTVIGLLGVGEDVTPRKELEQEARKSREVLESILSELSDAVFSLSVADGAVLRVNPATESLYGRSRAELLRMSGFWSAAIHPDDRAAVEEALLSLRSDGRMETRYRIVRPDGETRWVYDRRRVVGAPTRGTSRVDCLVTDVTGQKHAEERIENSLREKELLLREIHHRVKNNLSTVSSLLSLQEQYSHGKEAAGILREAMTRIRSMVLIHERLYQSASLSEIDAGDYVRSVTNHLLRLYGPRNVVVEHDIEPLGLDIDTAIPCGLIINELVSNALKYAFPDGQGGTVHVRMHHREPDGFILEVADTGVGIPDPTLVTRRDSLGMNLVHMLAEQLDGTVEIATASGTRVRIVAPVLHRKRRQS